MQNVIVMRIFADLTNKTARARSYRIRANRATADVFRLLKQTAENLMLLTHRMVKTMTKKIIDITREL